MRIKNILKKFLPVVGNLSLYSPVCKFANDEKKMYGLVPLELRAAIDSIPVELTRKSLYTYVTEEEAFTNRIQLIGPKKDIDKRICTMHVCFRVVGKQIMPPTMIFRNENRVESDPFQMPPFLIKKKFEYNGETRFEDEHYHPKMKEFVMWQDNAWLDNTCALAYFKKLFSIFDSAGQNGLIRGFSYNRFRKNVA